MHLRQLLHLDVTRGGDIRWMAAFPGLAESGCPGSVPSLYVSLEVGQRDDAVGSVSGACDPYLPEVIAIHLDLHEVPAREAVGYDDGRIDCGSRESVAERRS